MKLLKSVEKNQVEQKIEDEYSLPGIKFKSEKNSYRSVRKVSCQKYNLIKYAPIK